LQLALDLSKEEVDIQPTKEMQFAKEVIPKTN